MFDYNTGGFVSFGNYRINLQNGKIDINLAIKNTTSQKLKLLIISAVKDSAKNLLVKSPVEAFVIEPGHTLYYSKTLTSPHINVSDVYLVEIFMGAVVDGKEKYAYFKISTDELNYTRVPGIEAPSKPPAQEVGITSPDLDDFGKNQYTGVLINGNPPNPDNNPYKTLTLILAGLLLGVLLISALIKR